MFCFRQFGRPSVASGKTASSGAGNSAHHGSPCSAFLRVDGGSKWSFKNERSGAIGVGGFARDNLRRRLLKTIERLKQAREGARGEF